MSSAKWKCGHRAIFVCGLLALGMSLPAIAQKPERVLRIGWLDGGSASLPAHAEAFKEGLRELGWIAGQNVAVEWRYAETRYDRLPELANDMVKHNNLDVVVAVTNPEIRATAQVTSTVPIVMVAGTDPVGEGFISSFRQPGGNITGLTCHRTSSASTWSF